MAVPRNNSAPAKFNSLQLGGGTTPLLNFLLDEVMPAVSDTQWRLLCVIVRQTLGWQAEEKSVKRKPGEQNNPRKERDWLSHAQLKARTRRHSAAICAAIEELVRQRLIEVQDAQGRLLITPQERRRVQGRIFYRLHPRLKQESAIETSKAEKKGRISQSEMVNANKVTFSEGMISQSEFRKAKTKSHCPFFLKRGREAVIWVTSRHIKIGRTQQILWLNGMRSFTGTTGQDKVCRPLMLMIESFYNGAYSSIQWRIWKSGCLSFLPALLVM